MRIVTADKILESLGLEKTSENYQKLYKISDLILSEADDYFIYETALKRDLVSESKCDTCGRKKYRTYSSNGVFDGEYCPQEEIDGTHKKSVIQRIKDLIKGG